MSEEHKRKIGEANKGKKYPKKLYPNAGMRNKHFSEETKRKMSRAHKGQLAWNKGLTKLTDKRIANYGKKCEESLKGRKLSEEHKRRISIGRKGMKFSEKTKQNMSKAQKKVKKEMFAMMTKAERRRYCKSWIKAGHANPSSIEKMIWRVLNELDINYKTQVSFNDNKFIADIYIPSIRLIIECNGTYWHNCKIFPEKKIRDDALEEYANENGYKIIWLWQNDIEKNSKSAFIKGLKNIGGG